MVATIALVTLLATNTFMADTHSGLAIALLAGRADHIAFARIALYVWITPEICLTLVASSATESWSALASTVVRIASANVKKIFVSYFT
jgi:acetyl-CoA carboxylase alpha subunit